MTLTNRVVLITGGKRIGQVVARELAARGADIAVSYRGSKEEADENDGCAHSLGLHPSLSVANLKVCPTYCRYLINPSWPATAIPL